METRNLYEIELEDEFGKIKNIDIVSEEHRRVVSDITQLTDRLVKLKEVENEKRKIEIEQQKIEIERQKVDNEKLKVDADKEKANIERQKVDIEAQKIGLEEHKIDIDERRLEEDQKDRWARNLISGLSVAIPAGITLTGMVLMFLFEEKGTITSRAGSKIVDRIFRMK